MDQSKSSSSSHSSLSSMRSQLKRSLVLITLTLIGSLALALAAVTFVSQPANRLTQVSSPSAQQAATILNGINSSVASLQAWVIHGDETFSRSRQRIWSDEINPSLRELERLSKSWASASDQESLAAIKAELTHFKSLQETVEESVVTPGNTSTTTLFQTKSSPMAQEMGQAITDMIAQERLQAETQQAKDLLASLEESRATLASAMGTLREFLSSGNTIERQLFQQRWDAHLESIDRVGVSASILTSQQSEAFARYKGVQGELRKTIDQILKNRAGSPTNPRETLLANKITPTAERLTQLTKNLLGNLSGELTATSLALESRVLGLRSLLAALLALGLVIAAGTAWFMMRRVVTKIDGLVSNITKSVGQLAHAVSDFTSIARSLRNKAEVSANKFQSIRSTADNVRSELGKIAKSTQAISKQIDGMAESTKEMSSSIGEVAKSSERAAHVSKQATDLSSSSNEKITSLDKSVEEITSFIDIIQEVAEQTNLLALNATIEAARAGEMGKGFNVVASEVKELAKQADGATNDIRQLIEGVQSETREAVFAIHGITEVIENVNSESQVIASAAEQQSSTTQGIAESTLSTASGAQSVSEGVQSVQKNSELMSANIASLEEAVNQTLESATAATHAGQKVTSMAQDLESIVADYQR